MKIKDEVKAFLLITIVIVLGVIVLNARIEQIENCKIEEYCKEMK